MPVSKTTVTWVAQLDHFEAERRVRTAPLTAVSHGWVCVTLRVLDRIVHLVDLLFHGSWLLAPPF